MSRKKTTILEEPRLITTEGGAQGWLIGFSGGVEWVAYSPEEIPGLQTALKNRLK